MKSLVALLDELESKIPFIERENKAVSAANVGWHLEHSLLAFVKMISALEHARPELYKKTFNVKRIFVLTLGKMPRGVARAPESVKPGTQSNRSTIQPLLEKGREKAAHFEGLDESLYFTHPVFGDVRVKQARRVIAIHTLHHLKIINEIIERSNH